MSEGLAADGWPEARLGDVTEELTVAHVGLMASEQEERSMAIFDQLGQRVIYQYKAIRQRSRNTQRRPCWSRQRCYPMNGG
jgi:hypothetical protein